MTKQAHKKKPTKFEFDLSVPLVIRFDFPLFDNTLEKLGRQKGFVVKCTGGGTGGQDYDYSLVLTCEFRDEALRRIKTLRTAAWEWLKINWNKKLLLREVKVGYHF